MIDRIALFDADDTLTRGFTLFPVFDGLEAEGLIDSGDNQRVQELLSSYREGELPYSRFVIDSLNTAASSLKGRNRHSVNSFARRFFRIPEYPWFEYVKPLMSFIGQQHFERVLVTAEPQFIAGGIFTALGFTKQISSQFETDGEEYTGRVELALGSQQKAEAVTELLQSAQLSIGFGDSEGDIGMLELVDQAFCIDPTEELRTHAVASSWTIIEDPSNRDNEVYNLIRI